MLSAIEQKELDSFLSNEIRLRQGVLSKYRTLRKHYSAAVIREMVGRYCGVYSNPPVLRAALKFIYDAALATDCEFGRLAGH